MCCRTRNRDEMLGGLGRNIVAAVSPDGGPALKQSRVRESTAIDTANGELDEDLLERIALRAADATGDKFEAKMMKHMEESDAKWNGRVTDLVADTNKRVDAKLEASAIAQD